MTERRLGDNLMNQAVPDNAVPCTGLKEETKDGVSYWVIVPVEDVYVSKVTLAELGESPAQIAA